MSGKAWSKEELEYLENNWGNKSIPNIASKLNRTIGAVGAKAKRLGLEKYLNCGNYITFNRLIEELGYHSYNWTLKKFIKYGCPIKLKRKLNHNYKIIVIDEFWKWAEKNKSIIKFDKLEENSLGKEPKWVKEKRILDKKSLKIKNRPWSKEEENLLIAKVKSYKYTFSDLAKEFNRTEPAIRKKLNRLNCNYRPITNKKPFSKEDNEKLRELFLMGYSSDLIARELNKGEFTVMQKIRDLKKNPNIEFRTLVNKNSCNYGC
ncbi:hypothetical protein [uncultured Clostridium sp.]|uniref:hypothetical protein n=1 Tax=uncultured Clostridium sp. TaxID=59620 RepID=UPI0026112B66|nr:hypothetical protein [uncultured Clostridium sp.]